MGICDNYSVQECTIYTYVNFITCYYILSICVIYNDIYLYIHIIFIMYIHVYIDVRTIFVLFCVYALQQFLFLKACIFRASNTCFSEAIWLEKAHRNMVSKALILFLVGAQAGIYPDNHWDFSTELTADSADAFVKDNVDTGKTASWRYKGHGKSRRYTSVLVWRCMESFKSPFMLVFVEEHIVFARVRT